MATTQKEMYTNMKKTMQEEQRGNVRNNTTTQEKQSTNMREVKHQRKKNNNITNVQKGENAT